MTFFSLLSVNDMALLTSVKSWTSSRLSFNARMTSSLCSSRLTSDLISSKLRRTRPSHSEMDRIALGSRSGPTTNRATALMTKSSAKPISSMMERTS